MSANPKPKPTYCDAVAIDLMIQLNSGVKISDLKVRFSERQWRKDIACSARDAIQ